MKLTLFIYRYLRLIWILIIAYSCTSNPSDESKSMLSVEYLLVRGVDIDIFTPVRIECEAINSSFDKEIRQAYVKDKKIVKFLISNFEEQEKEQLQGYGVDARVKIVVLSNEESPKDEYCIGRLTFSHNGKCYKMSEALRKTITKVIATDNN